MHAIQHECAMRCIQPHVVHVNPCTLPLNLPMNPIACNMKRADGCKHHLYPARNNKNVLSFLSFTRQNQQRVVGGTFELFPPTAVICLKCSHTTSGTHTPHFDITAIIILAMPFACAQIDSQLQGTFYARANASN